MSETHCPRCGGARSGGLCPRCVLAAALDAPYGPDFDGAQLAVARIGSYRVFGEIARGGNGVVYRAWQTDLKRDVALKMLLSGRRDQPDALARFRREAELMAHLDDPGILPVYEVGEHDGVPYYSMKLAERGNLAERIVALRGNFATSARLVAQVARAVDRAHRGGVLHRDLKPSNIVFDAEDRPLVTDFGLARHLGADSSLTGAEALIGTPRYVAPEVITDPGAALTAAVDVYGLGAIFYELLTGQAPFAELTPLQVLQQVAARAPIAPRQLDPAIPSALETICLRCLEKRPRDRYAGADALAQALETWLAAGTRSRRRAMLPSRRRRIVLTATLVLLAGVAASTARYALRGPVAGPDPAVATRALAVIPVHLPDPPTAELAAVRTLAARLDGIQPLHVLPAEPVLAQAKHADFPADRMHRGVLLGAYLQIDVRSRRDANGEGLTVRVLDSLRNEELWFKRLDLRAIEAAADEIAAALKAQRSAPTPETRVPAAAVAEFVRGSDLFLKFEAGANNEAIEAFRRAGNLAPDWALPHAMLARCYNERSNRFADLAFWTDNAIEEAQRAIRLDPNLATAHGVLGQAYYNKGWWTQAAEAFDKDLALGGLRAGMARAAVHYARGEFDRVYVLLRTQADFESGEFLTSYLAALSLYSLGATQNAEALMHQIAAGARNPQNKLAVEAEIALYGGDYARCRELTSRLDPFQVSGGNTTAGMIGRDCAMHQDDYAGALALLEPELARKSAGKGDLDKIPELEQAILLQQLGHGDETKTALEDSRRQIQAAISRGSENWKNWQRLAALQRLSGDIPTAYETLDQAFAHGMTINPRTSTDVEFLPFKDDPRFAELRADQAAKLAVMRERALKP